MGSQLEMVDGSDKNLNLKKEVIIVFNYSELAHNS